MTSRFGSWILGSCVLLGCGGVGSDPDAPPGAGADGEAGADGPAPRVDAASSGRCDPAAPFGAPVHVPGINSSFDETGLSLTSDERIAFVSRTIQSTSQVIRMATRSSIDDDFSAATTDPLLAAINDEAGSEYGASTSGDGLLLYFHRQDSTGIGLEVAARAEVTQPFGLSRSVFVDGTVIAALTPHLSADGQTLYWLDFAVFRLHQAQRGSQQWSFTGGRDASSIDNVYNPVLSADQLTLYWSNGFGDDVLISTRADTSGTFGPGAPLDGVNSAADDWPAFLTEDGCLLYLASARPGGVGGMDLWVARRGP
jgi:hypothetical protein